MPSFRPSKRDDPRSVKKINFLNLPFTLSLTRNIIKNGLSSAGGSCKNPRLQRRDSLGSNSCKSPPTRVLYISLTCMPVSIGEGEGGRSESDRLGCIFCYSYIVNIVELSGAELLASAILKSKGKDCKPYSKMG